MRSRCPSAQVLAVSGLEGWAPSYDKPSTDSSSKLNIVERESKVHGVVYEIDDDERPELDAAEPGYEALTVNLDSGIEALTYRWTGPKSNEKPFDWYVATVLAGARHHGLPNRYTKTSLDVPADPDPVLPGVRPATTADLSPMQVTLSQNLTRRATSSTLHPGELAWWMHHGDPRYPDHLSFWAQRDGGVLIIDAKNQEISAFATPERSPVPLVNWGQRRLGNRGEVGFVSDDDIELVQLLQSSGYEPVATENLYLWDLHEKQIPDSVPPDGWVLRHLQGEHEANNRRASSHRAFKSKMDESMHLERYLQFMRSDSYEPERDLVAVSPEGRIASFMVWWPDESGIAQIEPFGTDPEFQGMGIGRALVYYGLDRMKAAGMKACRVVTGEERLDANGFYEGVGFDHVEHVRWWGLSGE